MEWPKRTLATSEHRPNNRKANHVLKKLMLAAMLGAVLPNGTLELSTADLFAECTDNTCEKLVLLGQGTDTDGDEKMDTYSGTFGGLVQVSGQLVPLVGNFTTAVSAS